MLDNDVRMKGKYISITSEIIYDLFSSYTFINGRHMIQLMFLYCKGIPINFKFNLIHHVVY